MVDAIGATLGLAIGIAISPVPVAAAILMLFSARARINSFVFLLAWLVGIALVTTVFVVFDRAATDDSAPSDTTGWIKLVLGLLLLAAAVRQWRSRPGPDEEPKVPGWMSRIDELRPGAAFGMGFVLSALNPKNLLLAAAAGATIGSLDLSDGKAIGAVAVFTLIAGLTVLVPVVGYQLAGDRLAPALDTTKSWLIANNAAVMAILFVVFGFSLLGDAIQILG